MSAAAFAIAALAALHASLAAWSSAAGRSSAAPVDWLEGGLAAVVSAVALSGWLALALATCGWFSLPALSGLLLAAAAATWLALRPHPVPSFAALGRREWAACALLAASAAFYARPHEYVLGGSDPGTYVSMAAAMAREGGVAVRDQATALLVDHAWLTLREQPTGWVPRYVEMVGWFVDDADPSRVVPQFLAFHPALLAIGFALAGLRGALLVTPLWAVLGLAAVFAVARRLYGATVGLVALALLAATPLQIYFARYPSTEPLALLLVWTALLAYQHLIDDATPSVAWGILGGSAIGAALLTRIDLPPAAAALALGLAFDRRHGRFGAAHRAFAIALAVLGAHAALHQLTLAWPYTRNSYAELAAAWQGATPRRLAVGSAALGALVGLALLARHLAARMSPGARRRAAGALRAGAGLSLVALSAFAYLLRPVLQPTTWAVTWPAMVRYPVLDGENWVRLGWYLTPLGLAAATAGAAAEIWRGDLRRSWPLLAVGGGATLLFGYRIFSTPYHLYAMRRYVPAALPALVVFAAVAVAAPLAWRRRRLGRAATALLVAALLVGLTRAARPVLAHRDFAGVRAQLEALDTRLAPGAIVLISEPESALFADAFGVPLRFAFGHEVVTLRRGLRQAEVVLDGVLDRAEASGRRVQAIAADPMLAVVPRLVELHPVGVAPVVGQALIHSYDAPPAEMQTARYEVEIYDVARRPPGARLPRGEATIDVGGMDSPFLLPGFLAKERVDERATGRWATAHAGLQVPVGDARRGTIEIRAIGYRPPQAPPGEVRVRVDGQDVGSFVPPADWTVFRFAAPLEPRDGFSLVLLDSETFNPKALGVSGDDRDLGVYVDWVRVRPDDDAPEPPPAGAATRPAIPPTPTARR